MIRDEKENYQLPMLSSLPCMYPVKKINQVSKFFHREECPKDDDTLLVVEEQPVLDLFRNTTITLEGMRSGCPGKKAPSH